MGSTRSSTARTGAVERRLRRLDSRQFVAFCAALWAARGYETRIDDDLIVATRGDERLSVLPRTEPGVLARAAATVRSRLAGRSATAVDRRIDVVVAPVDAGWASRLADHHGARLVGPTELADRLLYGIPRADADELAVRYLGAPTAALVAVDDATPRIGVVRSRPDPTTVVALAAVVCLVVAAAATGAWIPSRDDATATGTDGPPDDVDTEQVAPERTASADATYPPGVADGSLDVWVLSGAHTAAVDGRSYRFIVRHTGSEALAGDRRWDTAWQHAVVDGDVWLYSVVGYTAAGNDSRLVQYTAYADGNSVYRRAESGTDPVYERRPVHATTDGSAPYADRAGRYLRRYLATTAVRIDRPSWDPSTYRIVATGRPTAVDGAVSNYTATALVDRDGFVSSLSVEYTLDEGTSERTVRFRFEYAAVDDTRVRPPGWYDDARAATGTNTTRERLADGRPAGTVSVSSP